MSRGVGDPYGYRTRQKTPGFPAESKDETTDPRSHHCCYGGGGQNLPEQKHPRQSLVPILWNLPNSE